MEKILSICTCVYNCWAFTKLYLNDLSKLPNDHEIIIFDNGSSDQTKSQLENSKEIIYIRSDINHGFACGSNKAFAASNAPNVLFLNNDIKVRDNFNNWTQPLINECSDYIVGPTMGQLDDNLNFVKEANQLLPGKSYMSGWCLASSKKIFSKLNLSKKEPEIFSEKYGRAYFEDTDLSFRARKLGIPFKVVNIPVIHYGKQTSKQINTYQLYKQAREIFIKKWSKVKF